MHSSKSSRRNRGRFTLLINLSTEYVHVITEPDDIDEVRRYIVQYAAIDPVNGDRLSVAPDHRAQRQRALAGARPGEPQ